MRDRVFGFGGGGGGAAGVAPFVVAGIEFSKRIVSVTNLCTLFMILRFQKLKAWMVNVGVLMRPLPLVIMQIAQRRCNVCGGSGLVQRGEYYFRCGGCGKYLFPLCVLSRTLLPW